MIMAKPAISARFGVLFAMFVLSTSAFAASVTKVNDDALAPLREATVVTKIRIDKLPLYDSKRSVIELEEFQVWAPGGKVLIHDGKGGTKIEDPIPMRFFRGSVNGDPQSFAYFSVEVRTGRVAGLVATTDRNFAVAAARRRRPDTAPLHPVTDPGAGPADGYDYFLTATAPDEQLVEDAPTWQCDVDKRSMIPAGLRSVQMDAKGQPLVSQAISGTQHYSIRLEIETDDELFTNSGSNATTEQTYVTNLTGALSTIYNRDLQTDVLVTGTHLHTGGPGTDQWSATMDTSAALYELGTYYHNNPGYSLGAHSAVTMLSGKNIGGGIAWEAVVCQPDFYCGDTGAGCGDAAAAGKYGGTYAWCGGIGNLGTFGLGAVPDPNATVGGVLYGMPTGTQNFWPLAEYTHELGHNLAGHHTHCVAISDAERIASTFGDGSPANSTSNFVDHCYAHEGLAGCYAAATDYVSGSQTMFKGTIMSYCQNVSPQPQSRFTFGVASEPSIHELNDYMLKSAGPLAGGVNIVTATAAAMSSFTAPASVSANSTGNTASVSTTNATSYVWSISSGSVTSGQGTSSIQFTAPASGTITLKVTAYGSNNCGVTDSKSITVNATTYNPPTSVEAHATSTTQVLVSWTAATGTAPGRYNVYRSANPDYTNFSVRGNSVSTSFTDTVSNGTAYIYKVRSADAGGGNESSDSNRDLATVVIYTNPTLTGGSSVVQAADINELRTAVEAVRSLYGIGVGSYTYLPAVAGTTLIHKADIDQLRTNLNTALTGMGFGSPVYTNATITAGSSIVNAVDFNELRTAVR